MHRFTERRCPPDDRPRLFQRQGDIHGPYSLNAACSQIVVSYRAKDKDASPADLVLFDTNKHHLVTLTTSPHIDETHPVFSHDGKRIAYVSTPVMAPGSTADNPAPGTHSNVFVVDAKGGSSTQLTQGKWVNILDVQWSPDDKNLFFIAANQVYRLNVATRALKLLYSAPRGNLNTLMVLSPTSRQLFFSSYWNTLDKRSEDRARQSIYCLNLESGKANFVARNLTGFVSKLVYSEGRADFTSSSKD